MRVLAETLAADALSGLAFSHAINSFTFFAGIVFLAKRTSGVYDQRRDGFEIIQQVVWQRIESAVQHMRAQETEVNRIAIGPRVSEAADTDAPASSADVFNDDGLSKRLSHPLGKDSPDYI